MDKPITVARQEFMDGLVQLVNSSGLPAFIVEDVLRNTLSGVHGLAVQQYNADKQKYEKENTAKKDDV